MASNTKRGLAFHGPITQADGDWKLLRGPVSHGCNRMQGEPIVELAQIFGIDMRKPLSSAEHLTLSVKTNVIDDYDQVDGQLVDVAYPAQPTVKLPTGANAKVFATWDSKDQLATVCPWKSALWSSDPKKNATHCAYAGKNKLDPVTGQVQ